MLCNLFIELFSVSQYKQPNNLSIKQYCSKSSAQDVLQRKALAPQVCRVLHGPGQSRWGYVHPTPRAEFLDRQPSQESSLRMKSQHKPLP